jgi:outer membrane protein assembly factor BamB
MLKRALIAVPVAVFAIAVARADWPMFGGTPQRNMVNLVDKNVPTDWAVEGGKLKNIKWHAELGSACYGGPVVADGKVFVGTNNANPRDPAVKGSRAVLMAFNEADGKFLWQVAHDYPPDELFNMAISSGLCSTPVVEGKSLYYVTPDCEVICVDIAGKIEWRYDMMKELKVIPHHCGNCSPVVAGELVLVITSNGVNEDGDKVASPEAPSFIGLNKKTGKLVWASALPGANIIEGQWSNPTIAKVNGKEQVIMAGGDSFLYGLDVATGKMIWKFDCQPQREKGEDRVTPSYMIATPVVVDNKCYIGLGLYPEHPSPAPFSHFLCVDITKTGDVSPKTLDAKDPRNKGSALVWSYGGKIEPQPKRGRRVYFGRTISTAAVHEGLVYAAEEQGYMHCLDAKTGEKYWDFDFKAGIWGSPYYVDGKVYIGTEDGEIVIFKHGKKAEEINRVYMDETVHSTPVVSGGVLYVATKSKLYAIGGK